MSYLTEGVSFITPPGIPVFMNLKNAQIPKDIITFEKAKKAANKSVYVHFYMHDKYFSDVLTHNSMVLLLPIVQCLLDKHPVYNR